MVSLVLFLSKEDLWYVIAFIAVIASTILIISIWKDAKFGTIANVKILIAVLLGFSASTYNGWYKNEVKTGLKQTASDADSILTEADMSNLPDPVRKYIRYTGFLGKPKVRNFKVEFTGQLRKNEQSAWMPFTSEQYNFMKTSTRLFFLKAIMKGLPVAGFHSFKNGDAFMDIRLLSLLKVQYQKGKEMGIAETVTFFNDMCFMAPATLIDKRIKWLKIEGNRVQTEFINNNITISAWLVFNDDGELINFISEDRYAAAENNTMQKLPWLTPARDYMDINGIKLATNAEAVYKYPDRDLCYGTFHLTNAEYNCS
jgi:hypothetical protein